RPKGVDLGVVWRRSRAKGDVRADDAGERATAHAGQLPETLTGPRPCRERVAIGFDTAAPDDDDRVRTEFRHGVVLGGFAEGHESQVHAFRCADAKIGTRGAARLLARRTPELTLCFDPTTAKDERVGFAILAVGQQHLVS